MLRRFASCFHNEKASRGFTDCLAGALLSTQTCKVEAIRCLISRRGLLESFWVQSAKIHRSNLQQELNTCGSVHFSSVRAILIGFAACFGDHKASKELAGLPTVSLYADVGPHVARWGLTCTLRLPEIEILNVMFAESSLAAWLQPPRLLAIAGRVSGTAPSTDRHMRLRCDRKQPLQYATGTLSAFWSRSSTSDLPTHQTPGDNHSPRY
ncbi:uncharacterized protein MYCFIDRAFT_208119 [Pseudocercospora fijiensis CIRAD86]|uniref:Uncharacterized protein n=1 Tax=Pseudocercospora fijiensis (strain CIRAD86) TaxID=383855 RepID=M2YXK6_PSEFD|nr:uncharacterized protein MYCFIDRAFT_208119 [Pseudocercospora fijiensis CIRAD86]EME82435.1 hypothetical protein MYCFIDRAFT_208119 [Pseudocercospora fijiensis CIRAD86]